MAQGRRYGENIPTAPKAPAARRATVSRSTPRRTGNLPGASSREVAARAAAVNRVLAIQPGTMFVAKPTPVSVTQKLIATPNNPTAGHGRDALPVTGRSLVPAQAQASAATIRARRTAYYGSAAFADRAQGGLFFGAKGGGAGASGILAYPAAASAPYTREAAYISRAQTPVTAVGIAPKPTLAIGGGAATLRTGLVGGPGGGGGTTSTIGGGGSPVGNDQGGGAGGASGTSPVTNAGGTDWLTYAKIGGLALLAILLLAYVAKQRKRKRG